MTFILSLCALTTATFASCVEEKITVEQSSVDSTENSSNIENEEESSLSSESEKDIWENSTSSSPEDSSSAEEKIGIQYERYSDLYYSVVGVGTLTDGKVVIPDTYNGLPVRKICSSVFYRCEEMTSLEIGANVMWIESYAFSHCYNLTSVKIGENVESIDFHAFLSCSELTSVTIPAKVNFLGSGIFKNCDKLKEVVLENKEGWVADWKKFTAEELSDAKQTAEYFKETYKSFAWRRKEQ